MVAEVHASQQKLHAAMGHAKTQQYIRDYEGIMAFLLGTSIVPIFLSCLGGYLAPRH